MAERPARSGRRPWRSHGALRSLDPRRATLACASPRPKVASMPTGLTKSRFFKGRQSSRRLWLAARGVAKPAVESEDVWEEPGDRGATVRGLHALSPLAREVRSRLGDSG